MASPTHWGNWTALMRGELRERGLRSLPELVTRAALGAAVDLDWRLRTDPAPTRPVWMVLGHQRSGTTLLHRLLTDMPGAIGMSLQEQLLPVHLLQKLLLRARRPAWFDRVQDRVFGRHDDLHRLRLHEIEEDEFLLYALFRSTINVDDRPWSRAPALDFEGRSEVYAKGIASVLSRHPEATRYVGKNPHFTAEVPALRAAIPGVRVVQLVRHPAAAIASRLGLQSRVLAHRYGKDARLEGQRVAEIYARSLAFYRGGLGTADLDLRYTELVRDPVAAVKRVHRSFGGPELTEDDESAIRDRVAQRDTGKPRQHPRPRLEDFGLDPARVRSDLQDVYDYWGFDELPPSDLTTPRD